ncbi:response regulator [Chelativorans sp. J32]|uniref:response regulator n=1 Tax=Chelativorans sp. J32 TaxID=935840 RepID=UPI0004801025
MVAGSPKLEPLIYAIIAGLTLLPFAADLFLPLGTAIWVIYVLPVALCYLLSKPQAPLAVAAAITLLVVLGYIYAPPGVDPEIARINRALGVFTLWVVAGTSHFFIRNKMAVRRQEWIQAGQVGLSLNMAGEQRLQDMGSKILRFLAEYMDAKAGALFVRDGGMFVRTATYGVPDDAPVPETLKDGDGLIGQAASDQRSFVIEDVPDGYLYFGSSLGKSKPRQLLIAPAAADGQVNAVLELGFLRNDTADSVALVQQVSETIAIAVRSAQYRTRLQELLEETQRQAEELQAQSEELKAANDELQAQSRSLQESQARLELQQSELEQSNAQLEEQTQLLERQKDDLTRVQEQLQEQAQDLEQASRYKSEFLANMSHELRTPLNSLLIMARLLADNRGGNLTADQIKYAQTIETAGNDLLTLINDILDISRIEAGHLEIQPQRVRIDDITRKLETTFQPSAMQKGLSFRTEVSQNLPAEMEIDPQRIEQVLKNFLSNALKFTEKGEVALLVERRGENRIAFTVRDTGIGIPKDKQEAIFEAFHQADGSVSRKYGGTGLGLSICRELAKLLGGEIELESDVGSGSSFTLVVPEIYEPNPDAAAAPEVEERPRVSKPEPISKAKKAARAAALSPENRMVSRHVVDDRERLAGDRRTILVVEDDPAFAQILYELAHELGFQCLIAGTADEGILLARQYLPSGVILDIGLPDHSGLLVLDRIKHDVRTRHIPVHVVSVGDYTQLALSFGAVSYMLKPVKRDELARALRGLETRLAQRMRRVLIVEDDERQRESLRLLLSSHDVEAIDVSSAAECLERLKGETFDCMVLDLSLPDASGFDVLEQLSRDEAYAFPPPIVYTGRDLSADEELRLRKFSKSIIIKGAKSPERLLDEVTLFLHQVVSDLPEQKREMLSRSLSRDAALDGRRILVVEDDIRNVYALMSIFEPHGAIVQIARNGREALDALEAAAKTGSTVDFVLMDIMMPEMDGLTATREIRKQKKWRSLPIIALTAKAMAGDQEQCLAAGANDYLAKPLDVDKLLSLVRVWMPR